ncbi:hypothetical protein [Flavobacterium alvei]|nr:hypothetical protein [Flavobacterium alvei]
MSTNLFKYSRLACLFLMINCSNIKLEENRLVGHWTGKIPETSAELYFNKDGRGSIFYSNFKSTIYFKYIIKHDSILSLGRGISKSEHYFKIKGAELQLRPIKSDEETTDIINEFTFSKVLSNSASNK